MSLFQLQSPFLPEGDQVQAIKSLTAGVMAGRPHQVLLGVTGSGKTFSIANVIRNTSLPTLVISHNKTLAGQLYQEFRDFFPHNAVSYFVSYYDYYQPEAYVPRTDTYIEKEADINQEIDKLRLETTTNLLTRKDVIVVASVSCIYNIGSPQEYGSFIQTLKVGTEYVFHDLFLRFTQLQYQRSDYSFTRGTFRVRGDVVDLHPSYQTEALRLTFTGNTLSRIESLEPVSGHVQKDLGTEFVLYPAKHYLIPQETMNKVFPQIEADLAKEVLALTNQHKLVEAQRLNQRVNYDLEMIREFGYVNGIENYSRYFDGRHPGDPPYTLLDYFPRPYLLVIDESHITIPQLMGMYRGDESRKRTLIDYGFRLQASFDNRPLNFEEILRHMDRVIYTSATPGPWELSRAEGQVVEQLIRPTGVVDPEITIRPSANQIPDLMAEIAKRVGKGQRTLVTTLTKKMAEDLAEYLKEKGLNVHYLHSGVTTLDRSDTLADLRAGKYDVLVGINLLREGLDLPEVSLVAILDADKEGFLRSETSLVQTMGRAARHIEGKIILYADHTTGSMDRAIKEVSRRRQIQLDYNAKHHITPRSIQKPIREKLVDREIVPEKQQLLRETLVDLDFSSMLPAERKKVIRDLRREMQAAAEELNFELAAHIRDKLKEVG